MGSVNLPTTRECSSARDIIEEFTKKRFRKKLDMLTNEEEQEEEYLQTRQVKRRASPAVEDELARLMMNLNLPCGRVQGEREQDTAIQSYKSKRKLTDLHDHEDVKRRKTLEHISKKIKGLRITTTEENGYNRDLVSLPTDIVFHILDKLLEPIDHARFAAVCDEWKALAKLYNWEKQPWLKVLPPMLWILRKRHGSSDPSPMLYSLSERKLYRNINLPAPSDDRIYCSYGWMAELQHMKTSPNNACLAITLMNPFGNASDTIRLPRIQSRLFHVKQNVKIILPADPTLDRKNYVVLAICGHRLYFIRGGQEVWSRMHNRCSAATYYEGRVFSVVDFGTTTLPAYKLLSCRVSSDDRSYKPLEWLHKCNKSHLVQTYFATSTKGELLVVVRLRGEVGSKLFHERKMLRFKVFKWVESTAELNEVGNIGDEAVFVGNNQSVCVLASKFPGCRPNSIYYTDDVDPYGQRLEDMGIFYLEDGSYRTITQDYPHKFLEGQMRAIWFTPTFPVLN